MKSIFSMDKTQWIRGFVVSILVPAVIAWGTIQVTMQREIDKGQAVFNAIGYRYFGALAGTYDLKTRKPLGNKAWKAYRAILSDIQEDIRWLRTNPVYGDTEERTMDFAFVQNLLIAESVPGTSGANRKSYCQIWCMGVLNQAASLPISLSSIPSMNFTSATTPAR